MKHTRALSSNHKLLDSKVIPSIVIVILGCYLAIFDPTSAPKNQPETSFDEFSAENVDIVNDSSQYRKAAAVKKTFSPVAKITAQPNSLKKTPSSKLSIVPFNQNNDFQQMPLSYGMVNVTEGGAMFVVTQIHDTAETLIIPCDPDRIPDGYTIHDVYSYGFDKLSKQWLQLERDSVDAANNAIYSTVTKDGDYINAIIKAPDAPQTQGFAPTTMNDIKVGDPASMVQIIAPPTENNQGTANLKYHIEIPPGRQGLQPDLNITYNSDGGNGWIGEGWSLSGISTISVDTRWGVPLYDNLKETETYLLDGEMLAYHDNGKTANRFLNIPRLKDSVQFEPRRQSGYQLIQRFGDSPEQYYWVITDNNGTKYFYGKESLSQSFPKGAILEKKDTSGKRTGIAEWKLVKVIDVFGNNMRFKYKEVEGKPYQYGYPDSICYTLNDNVKFFLTTYLITFNYDTLQREDNFALNGRFGFVINPNAWLLTGVSISRIYNKENSPEPIRQYRFAYKKGAFGKSILAEISQYGHYGNKFNSHQFDYHNEKEALALFVDAQVEALSSPNLVAPMRDPLKLNKNATTAIGASKTSSKSNSMYVGFGSGSTNSVNQSGGIFNTNNSSNSLGINTLIDINADGLPDQVYVNNSGQLEYRKNTSSFDTIKFHPIPITIIGVNQFLEEKSRTTGWGARFIFNLEVGVQQTRTENSTNTYFSDVNGDGLIDIVKDGEVFFNEGYKLTGHYFSKNSSNTPNPIWGGKGIIEKSIVYVDSFHKERVKNSPLQEVVKTWEAPFAGIIMIEDTVERLPIPSHYTDADGVYFSIQHNTTKLAEPLPIDDQDKHTIKHTIDVKKGDKIFFRLQSGQSDSTTDGAFDRIKSNPKITYKNTEWATTDTLDKTPVLARYIYRSANDYLLSNPTPIPLPDSIRKIDIHGKFSKKPTMDSVTIQIVKFREDTLIPGAVLYEKHFGPLETWDTLIIPTIPINKQNLSIQCIIKSDVNIDLHDVVWEPELHLQRSFPTTRFDQQDYLRDSIPFVIKDTVYVVPYYVFNDTLKFVSTYKTESKDTALAFYPSFNLEKSKNRNVDLDSSFWLAVKSTQHVLGKKIFNYKNGHLIDNGPLNVSIPKNTPYIVSIEAQGTKTGKLKDSLYQQACDLISSAKYYHPLSKAKAKFTAPTLFSVPSDGNYQIFTEAFINGKTPVKNGEIIIHLNQSSGTPIQTDTIFLKNTEIIHPLNPFEIPLKANDQVALSVEIQNDTIKNHPELAIQFMIAPCFNAEFWVNRKNEAFGPMYRHWGQFIYNGMEGRAKNVIDPAYLTLTQGRNLPNLNSFRDKVRNIQKNKSTNFEVDADFDKLSAARLIFSPLLPFVNKSGRYWVGAKDSIFVKAYTLSTSRLGLDDVKKIDPFPSLSLLSNTSNTYGRAIRKMSRSVNYSFWEGVSLLNANIPQGRFEQVTDFMDLNGDHYPDIINGPNIQFTNPLGTLDRLAGSPTRHSGRHSGGGVSVNGSSQPSSPNSANIANKEKNTNAGSVNISQSQAAAQKAEPFLGASAAYNESKDNVLTTWMDVNADGLPDKVDALGYHLNLGYGTYKKFDFNIGEINRTQDISLSPGISAGFSVNHKSFSGGAGLSFSASKSTQSVQDMNGDGMPDNVAIDNDNILVNINTGKKFINYLKSTAEITEGGTQFRSLGSAASLPTQVMPKIPILKEWFDLERTKFNASNAVSLGTSFTHGFTIKFVKVVFNPSFSQAEGIGKTIRQIIDINGDGFSDIVYSPDNQTLKVKISNLGKSNKLKKVSNPLNGSFELDYAHMDATTAHQGGKWVMSQLTINDGVKSDRADSTKNFDSKKVFSYSGGKFDRFEREFLGFAEVVATDIDFDSKTAYRDFVHRYDTSSYYLAGHLTEDLIRKNNTLTAAGHYTITKHFYLNFSKQKQSPPLFKREIGIVFTALKSTVNGTHEGASPQDSNAILWLNKTNYEYHPKYGYTTRFTYKENPENESDSSFDYQTDISYEDPDPHRIIGLPNKVVTKNQDGTKILKRVEAVYYKWSNDKIRFNNSEKTVSNKRKLRKYIVFLNKDTTNVTEYHYDTLGNIVGKTLPNGLALSYEYDVLTSVSSYTNSNSATYILKVTNLTRNNLASTTKYDYRFGIPIEVTDVNGKGIKYKLDEFGRVINVLGPKQCSPPGVNTEDCDISTYTISIHYSLNGTIAPPKGGYPIAKVYQYIGKRNKEDNLQTINFIDGFKRSVQIKKTAVVSDANGNPNNQAKWVVSGKVVYDAFGRAVKNYYPDIDTDDIGTSFLNRSKQKHLPTLSFYDPLDRPVKHILPNTHKADSIVYTKDKESTIVTTIAFNKDLSGVNNQIRRVHTNGSNLTSKEVYIDPQHRDVTTLFSYDPVHQLLEVRDAKGIVTQYEYDWAGNKTTAIHPDAGITRYKYNSLGNLYAKITANKDSISYKYDHDRLVKINYPRHKENDVLYVYSDNPASNSVNRVVYQEDASGKQAFEYGSLGETTKITRTILLPFSDTALTFTTYFKYDTWNRLQKVTYTDGDSIIYTYDKAGQLQKVIRRQGDIKMEEIISNITYNEFGQRTSMTYGNKVKTNYAYDTLRRISTTSIKPTVNPASSDTLSHTAYQHDNQNNITSSNTTRFFNTQKTGIHQQYFYDNVNRLDSADGKWSNKTNTAEYNLSTQYDEVFNMINRKLILSASSVTSRNQQNKKIGYINRYQYGPNDHQLKQITEEINHEAKPVGSTKTGLDKEKNIYTYQYDKNGNDSTRTTADSFGFDKISERKINWDEENRVNAISMNGYVSHYVYDANGDRTVKLSIENAGAYINGKFVGDTSAIASYTLYVNPYFSMRNGNGLYTKHIYIDDQRIVSQVENNYFFNIAGKLDPAKVSPKDCEGCSDTISLVRRKNWLNERINNDYDKFHLPHEYIKYKAFNKRPSFVYAKKTNPFDTAIGGKELIPPASLPLRYYYHSNHIGSTSFITNDKGVMLQYIDYLPYGETFIEQRQNYSSQFLFSAKEQDQETGLYYFGARYYDPVSYQWLGVDPMAEKYPELSPYNYCLGNPVRLVDKKGEIPTEVYNRITGAMYTLGGVSEIATGLAIDATTSWSVVGAVVGTMVIGHGVDRTLTGIKQIKSGQDEMSSTAQIFQSALNLSPSEAKLYDDGLSMLFTGFAQPVVSGAQYYLSGATKGISVIGPRATYREFGKKIGANFLNVTDEAWTMRKNVEFLQGVVKRGDDVIFSGKFNPAIIDPKSVLAQEIRYLQRRGYSWVDDFSRMIKKQN